MEPLKKRQIELERQSNVVAVEAASLMLQIESSKTFKIKDLQTYQRIKTRFNRLKLETGMAYETQMEGNNVTVKRIA